MAAAAMAARVTSTAGHAEKYVETTVRTNVRTRCTSSY